jgi:hypothetical protein
MVDHVLEICVAWDVSDRCEVCRERNTHKAMNILLAREPLVALVYSDTTYIHPPHHSPTPVPKRTYFITFLTALSIKTLSYC